nr:MAG TPA: hypothetical protein [Caudoviricetes sp.]
MGSFPIAIFWNLYPFDLNSRLTSILLLFNDFSVSLNIHVSLLSVDFVTFTLSLLSLSK